MMSNNRGGWALAACFRAEWLALAIFHAGDLVEVRRHRVSAEERSPERLAPLIAKFAGDYGVTRLIIEPNALLAPVAAALRLSTYPLTITEAKETLLRSATANSHQALCDHLVAEHARLRRLVTVLDAGRVALSQGWRTVVLLAVALGLAAHDRSELSTTHPRLHSSIQHHLSPSL